MNIHNYKVGDTVKIVSSRHSFQWYNTKIDQEYKVSCRYFILGLFTC